MATPRHRRGGAATPNRPQLGGFRPIYEDFKPASKWSQDDDTYILTIQVPGFMKEQLKVSTEDLNIIRVGGGRLIANNKWSHFEEDFRVPDNSELTSVRAKHDGGTLIITVPRKNIAAGRTLAKETPSPPPKAKDQVLPPKTTGMKSPREPETDYHSRDRVTPAISSSKPIKDDRSLEPAPGIQKTSGDHPRIKFGQQEDEQKSPELTEKPAARKRIVDDKNLELLGTKRTSDDYPGTRTGRKEDEQKKGIQETKEKHVTPETPTWKNNVGKGKEITEVHEDHNNKKIKSKKISKEHRPQIAKSNDSPGALKMELKKYEKKGVKGIGELNEERQLLVNMGTALLIIVGLSAYVAYNFASQNAKH